MFGIIYFHWACKESESSVPPAMGIPGSPYIILGTVADFRYFIPASNVIQDLPPRDALFVLRIYNFDTVTNVPHTITIPYTEYFEQNILYLS